MRNYRRRIILFFVVLVLLLTPAWLYAIRRVVFDTSIEERDGCAVIHVEFNFPVQYIRHFPVESGPELRVQFEPISIGSSDRENQFERENVWFSQDETVPLSDVIFEGNISGGPFLTLIFERDVSFEVVQGDDFRSIDVTPFQDKERTECFPTD